MQKWFIEGLFKSCISFSSLFNICLNWLSLELLFSQVYHFFPWRFSPVHQPPSSSSWSHLNTLSVPSSVPSHHGYLVIKPWEQLLWGRTHPDSDKLHSCLLEVRSGCPDCKCHLNSQVTLDSSTVSQVPIWEMKAHTYSGFWLLCQEVSMLLLTIFFFAGMIQISI
jgi:hypothetical protein